MRRFLGPLVALLTCGAILGAALGLAIATAVPSGYGPDTPVGHAGASEPDRIDRRAASPSASAPTEKGGSPPSTETPGEPSPSPSTASPHPVPVIDARAYDPLGDGEEHDELVPLAADGEPSTVWKTEHYSTADFGGLKEGVGLLLDLGKPRAVRTVHLRLLPGGGASFQLRAGNAAGSLADLPVVATVTDADTTVTVRPRRDGASGEAAALSRRYWLVWFTRLAPQDENYRAGISQIRFVG